MSMGQVILCCAIAVCIHLAFDQPIRDASLVFFLSMQLFFAASFIPLPGASGASESGFCFFYRGLFPDSSLMAAMVCWRFFSYYLLMILGLIFMAVGRTDQRRRSHMSPAAEGTDQK